MLKIAFSVFLFETLFIQGAAENHMACVLQAKRSRERLATRREGLRAPSVWDGVVVFFSSFHTMGCCFSKAKADGEGERKPLLAPEPIPASSPGANTGVERRPSFKEDVKDVGLKATLMTGQALLEVAQQVPLLAPVAFLVGAVASSAAEAVVLKEDCAQFQVLIEHLEKILVRAESLEDHGASVNEIRDTLTEALQLMETLKTQGALKSVFVAESQKSRFEDLRVRIQQAIARLNLSAAVDTAVITKAKFRQSEELAKKVEDLGGFEAVVDDPRKMEQVSSMMEGGERVVANVVQRARHDIAEVGRELRASQRLMDSIHEAQEDAVKKVSLLLLAVVLASDLALLLAGDEGGRAPEAEVPDPRAAGHGAQGHGFGGQGLHAHVPCAGQGAGADAGHQRRRLLEHQA